MLKVKDTIILEDNNEYVVVFKTTINDLIYYYLIDLNNDLNIKFCYEKDDCLIETKDPEIITKIITAIVQK